jgi:prephenate dehydrogenase
MDDRFKISVIGLGLIGASLARALRGFNNGVVCGYDCDPFVLGKAEKDGVVEIACETPEEAVAMGDLVILCIYPDAMAAFVEQHRDRFKSGAILSDVAGVKNPIIGDILKVLPDNIDYISIHPMAGRENCGYDYASDSIFKGTGLILLPARTGNRPGTLALFEKMAGYIGAKKFAFSKPETHDRIIAYTSHLTHIIPCAYCLEPPADIMSAFTAGSFTDCTRVASINPELWTGLFLMNREYLLEQIESFMENVKTLTKAIEDNDHDRLLELLTQVRYNKDHKLSWN